MIVVHQPPGVWGLPSMSPFCVKLETYLRMAKVEYKNAPGNPMIAPKGKIPYANVDGQIMGDSGLIIDHLKQTKGDPLDKNLSIEQKAIGLAVRRMVEEHLYFATAWLRWSTEESLSHVRTAFLGFLPPVVGHLIFKKLRRDFLRSLTAQGIGRHTREEIQTMAEENLKALSVLLGDKPFFFGSEPTSIDATLYGFLIQLFGVPWDSPVIRYARSLPNLESYCQRMKQRYWAS